MKAGWTKCPRCGLIHIWRTGGSCPRCHPDGDVANVVSPARGGRRGPLLAALGVGVCAAIGFEVVWAVAGERPTAAGVLALLAFVPVLVAIALAIAWLPRAGGSGSGRAGRVPSTPVPPPDLPPPGTRGREPSRGAPGGPPRREPIARITPRPAPSAFALCSACSLEHPRRSNWRCPRCGSIVS